MSKPQEEKEKARIKITITGKWSFKDSWKTMFFGSIPPEVINYFEKVSELGVDKSDLAAYFLTRILDEDPLKMAKETLNWITELKSLWIGLKEAELKQEVTC